MGVVFVATELIDDSEEVFSVKSLAALLDPPVENRYNGGTKIDGGDLTVEDVQGALPQLPMRYGR